MVLIAYAQKTTYEIHETANISSGANGDISFGFESSSTFVSKHMFKLIDMACQALQYCIWLYICSILKY